MADLESLNALAALSAEIMAFSSNKRANRFCVAATGLSDSVAFGSSFFNLCIIFMFTGDQ